MVEPVKSTGGKQPGFLAGLSLRVRVFLFFAFLAAVVLAALGLAGFVIVSKAGGDVVNAVIVGLWPAAFALVGIVIWVWMKFDEHVARPIEHISSRIRASVHAGSEQDLAQGTGRYLGFLAPAVSEMVGAMHDARQNRDAAIARAVADADRQKARLESVLRDLHQAVIICTLDHKILLYNHHALDILGQTGEIGLGRSLTRFIRDQALRHTLRRLVNRFRAGRHVDHKDGLTAPLAAVALDGHASLHGRMALMLDAAGNEPEGYVIIFDDISDALSAGLWRDRVLADVTADMRQRMANILLITEVLKDAGSADAGLRSELADRLDAEQAALSERFERLEAATGDLLSTAWPMGEVLSLNLLDLAANRKSENRDLDIEISGSPIWLYCDSGSISDLLDRLLNRLAVYARTGAFTLTARRAADAEVIDACLEIGWHGDPVPQAIVDEWLAEPIEEDARRITGQSILSHHNTEVWSARNGDMAVLCLPLTVARERELRPERSRKPAAQRPEFYDFNLANQTGAVSAQDTPLARATYVVFDTETTGLDPANGDEMISIGAVRIVNGRVLRGEVFNAFVNPSRPIPPASTRIHGITDAMVADAASADTVLAAFRDFVGDAVLVAHNAAFDMSFLAKGQKAAGVRFDDIPVIDTVLLAAHLFGPSESLTLDALAERFQVVIEERDRHTALGDALATADVLNRLNDMLIAAGITTLGAAMDASNRQIAIRRQQKKNYS